MTDQRTFRVTLRARPDRIPAHKRLGQLLKYALRRQGLVAVDVAEVKPEGASPPPTASPGERSRSEASPPAPGDFGPPEAGYCNGEAPGSGFIC
jgi:hypothetical protein